MEAEDEWDMGEAEVTKSTYTSDKVFSGIRTLSAEESAKMGERARKALDAVIVSQPIATAPKDGTPVRLTVRYEQKTWRTESEYHWNGRCWLSVSSGCRMPSHLTVIGWSK